MTTDALRGVDTTMRGAVVVVGAVDLGVGIIVIMRSKSGEIALGSTSTRRRREHTIAAMGGGVLWGGGARERWRRRRGSLWVIMNGFGLHEMA